MPEPNYPASSPQLLQRGWETLSFAEGGTEGPGAVTCPLSPPGHPRGLHPGAGNGAGGGQKGDEAVSVPARWPNWVTPGQRGDLRFNPQSPGTCRAWRAGRGGHCVLGGVEHRFATCFAITGDFGEGTGHLLSPIPTRSVLALLGPRASAPGRAAWRGVGGDTDPACGPPGSANPPLVRRASAPRGEAAGPGCHLLPTSRSANEPVALAQRGERGLKRKVEKWRGGGGGREEKPPPSPRGCCQ